MNIFKTKNKGFTIIELIVVIAIIAVLSAIVVTNVTVYQKKARNSKRLADVKNYVTALEIAFENNSSYPSSNVWCCLGDGYTDDRCWGLAYEYYECPSVNAVLQPYIALPIDNYSVIGSNGNDYRGYLYRLYSGNRFYIYWFLEGTYQSCGIGEYPPGYTGAGIQGNTYCYYTKTL